MQTKYVFVTGGVTSSLGKGIICASLGRLLENRGLRVTIQKFDPYINVDPGTMNPYEHGEVYVTDDGAETDLDLGHYERFLGVPTSQANNVTTGRVYLEVINKERSGAYLGRTVQVVPHIIDEIKHWMQKLGETGDYDVVLTEIGGTVGDIEGLPYLEAIRQMRHEYGKENTLFVHLTLLPYLKAAKELKTKPTQASVRELRSIGIQPDIIMTRADKAIPVKLLKKISQFCDVEEDHVIPAVTCKSIYEVPLKFNEHKLTELIASKLHLGNVSPMLEDWKTLVSKISAKRDPIKIALVGKYTGLDDAYLSVIESLKIACYHQDLELDLIWVDSEKLEEKDEKAWETLESSAGILVPGGFGIRGTEGKILAAKYARKNKVPYLGICLGLQIMTIEYARHHLKDDSLNSEEFDENEELGKDKHVIHFLPGQHKNKDKGATLRLGSYPCMVQKDTLADKLYGQDMIIERHRHRYEINNKFKQKLEGSDWVASGIYEEEGLVEIAELKNHPFMIGSQFHPEFLSRPHRPHPLFYGLIEASAKAKNISTKQHATIPVHSSQ